MVVIWNEIQNNWKNRRIKNQGLLLKRFNKLIAIIFQYCFSSHVFSYRINHCRAKNSFRTWHFVYVSSCFWTWSDMVGQQCRVHLFKFELFDIRKDNADARHKLLKIVFEHELGIIHYPQGLLVWMFWIILNRLNPLHYLAVCFIKYVSSA